MSRHFSPFASFISLFHHQISSINVLNFSFSPCSHSHCFLLQYLSSSLHVTHHFIIPHSHRVLLSSLSALIFFFTSSSSSSRRLNLINLAAFCVSLQFIYFLFPSFITLSESSIITRPVTHHLLKWDDGTDSVVSQLPEDLDQIVLGVVFWSQVSLQVHSISSSHCLLQLTCIWCWSCRLC